MSSVFYAFWGFSTFFKCVRGVERALQSLSGGGGGLGCMGRGFSVIGCGVQVLLLCIGYSRAQVGDYYAGFFLSTRWLIMFYRALYSTQDSDLSLADVWYSDRVYSYNVFYLSKAIQEGNYMSNFIYRLSYLWYLESKAGLIWLGRGKISTTGTSSLYRALNVNGRGIVASGLCFIPRLNNGLLPSFPILFVRYVLCKGSQVFLRGLFPVLGRLLKDVCNSYL